MKDIMHEGDKGWIRVVAVPSLWGGLTIADDAVDCPVNVIPDHPALPGIARLMAEEPSLGNDLRKLLDFNCPECVAGGDWRDRLERLCVALGWEPLGEASHD